MKLSLKSLIKVLMNPKRRKNHNLNQLPSLSKIWTKKSLSKSKKNLTIQIMKKLKRKWKKSKLKEKMENNQRIKMKLHKLPKKKQTLKLFKKKKKTRQPPYGMLKTSGFLKRTKHLKW